MFTASVIPGTVMALMGVGLIPIDEGLADIANVFLLPLHLPLRPFLTTLGLCKILGCASLWNKGPMPEVFGRYGLITANACAIYGHYAVGNSIVAIVGTSIMLGLWIPYSFMDDDAKAFKSRKE